MTIASQQCNQPFQNGRIQKSSRHKLGKAYNQNRSRNPILLAAQENPLSASVEFSGVAAMAVSNSGPNYVWATVPAAATTGPLTVTIPGGTYTTEASFMVE